MKAYYICMCLVAIGAGSVAACTRDSKLRPTAAPGVTFGAATVSELYALVMPVMVDENSVIGELRIEYPREYVIVPSGVERAAEAIEYDHVYKNNALYNYELFRTRSSVVRQAWGDTVIFADSGDAERVMSCAKIGGVSYYVTLKPDCGVSARDVLGVAIGGGACNKDLVSTYIVRPEVLQQVDGEWRALKSYQAGIAFEFYPIPNDTVRLRFRNKVHSVTYRAAIVYIDRQPTVADGTIVYARTPGGLWPPAKAAPYYFATFSDDTVSVDEEYIVEFCSIDRSITFGLDVRYVGRAGIRGIAQSMWIHGIAHKGIEGRRPASVRLN